MCRVIVEMFKDAYPEHVLKKENFEISPHYLVNFRERQNLTTRKAHWHRRPQDKEEMQERIQQFNEIKAELFERFKDELWRLANADESFYGCGIAGGLTYAIKGSEGVDIHINHNQKKGVTIIATITADGRKLPLTIVCKGLTDRCHQQVSDDRIISNEKILHSESGWSTHEVFKSYLEWVRDWYDQAFGDNESYRRNNKIILFLDTYSSHRNKETKDLAKELNIDLVYIPVGCTDLCQPLDVKVFGALKNMATRMWWDFYAIDQTLVCTLKMAVYILVQCWKCLDENLIIEAWNMHEADLRENERILSKVTDEQAAEFLEKIEQVREEYIHKAEQALPQGENLDMLRDFSEIPERRYRRQEGEIDSDDDEEWHPEADLDGFSDDDLDFIDEYDLNSTEDESSVDPPSDYEPGNIADAFSPIPVEVEDPPSHLPDQIFCSMARGGASFINCVDKAPQFEAICFSQAKYLKEFADRRTKKTTVSITLMALKYV